MIDRWFQWVRARALSTRIAFILVLGLVLTQLFTGTILLENRHQQMLETALRVSAVRVADAVRSAQAGRDRPSVPLAFDLTLQWRDRIAPPPDDRSMQGIARERLRRAVAQRLGPADEVRVLDLQLPAKTGRIAHDWATIAAAEPALHFAVATRAGGRGRWLVANGAELLDSSYPSRTQTMLDYVLRIYVLRIILIGLLTWWAVRLAMAPLQRMAQAAERLGTNINSPPLGTVGPCEVRQAAEAFNAMQRRILSQIEERTRFLAAVSHDLRSPITRLRLRTEMLPSEQAKVPFRRDLAEMEALVDATLSFVKSGSDESVLVAIDLDAMLVDMVADLAAQGVQGSLEGAVGTPVRCYPRSMRRCIQNLLDNAVRYGGGHVWVRVFPCEDSIEITVQDDGPGIAEEDLTRVLEPFVRLDESRNRNAGGIGLGLSIASTIATAHQGTLTLTNRARGLSAQVRIGRL